MSSRTLYSVLEQTAAERGTEAALHQPAGKGKYRICTWKEYRDFAREFATGLRALGVRKGDIVAIYSETASEPRLRSHALELLGRAIRCGFRLARRSRIRT